MIICHLGQAEQGLGPHSPAGPGEQWEERAPREDSWCPRRHGASPCPCHCHPCFAMPDGQAPAPCTINYLRALLLNIDVKSKFPACPSLLFQMRFSRHKDPTSRGAIRGRRSLSPWPGRAKSKAYFWLMAPGRASPSCRGALLSPLSPATPTPPPPAGLGAAPSPPPAPRGRGLVSVSQREPVLPLSFLSENICK